MEIMDSVKSMNDLGRTSTSACSPTPKQAGYATMCMEYIKMKRIEKRNDLIHNPLMHTFTESDREMGNSGLVESIDQRPLPP
jgi:hypothetical protein